MTEILKRAEILCSEAKAAGLWDKKKAEEFCKKVESGDINEPLFLLIEQEVYEILKVLES